MLKYSGQHGIPQYWIVDGNQRHVEVWTPEAHAPVIERERLVWRHPALDQELLAPRYFGAFPVSLAYTS